MAQLVERPLSTSEVQIQSSAKKLYWTFIVNFIEKTKIKKKEKRGCSTQKTWIRSCKQASTIWPVFPEPDKTLSWIFNEIDSRVVVTIVVVVVDWTPKLTKPEGFWVSGSATRFGDFCMLFSTNFSLKLAQIFWNYLGNFEVSHFLRNKLF